MHPLTDHAEHHQRLLRMLEDQLGAHGPITRADAAEVALYWLAVVRPTREELEDILSRFPETLDES